MSASVNRRTRVVWLVSLVAVAAVLSVAGVQCELLGAAHPGHDGHVFATPAQAIAHNEQPGHAHVDGAGHRMKPDIHATMLRPRVENPLRLLGLVVLAVMLAAFVQLLASAQSRGPPAAPVQARSGRHILQNLCVNRC